mgnify:CR=1 FL=1
MANIRKIYCCGCGRDVPARLTDGREIYPHREDLWKLPFWKCDACGNYVGCHHKTADRKTQPLGVIPTQIVRLLRIEIHNAMDWHYINKKRRTKMYRAISQKLGRTFHSADLRTVEECEQVLEIIRGIKQTEKT